MGVGHALHLTTYCLWSCRVMCLSS